MDAELSELYQQVILDHNKNPRNFGKLENANHHAEGFNPLCGDHIDIFVIEENGIIKDIKFDGSGCAISKASASIMTSLLKGKSTEEAHLLFDKFHEAIMTDTSVDPESLNLGKLQVFCGVREFPARVKCASLAWHTMNTALDNTIEKVVSTE